MIQAELIGDDRVTARLGRLGRDLSAANERAITALTIELLRKVKADKLSGQVLNVKTGRLRRSITQRITGGGTSKVEGVVGTIVKYGATHEFGGPVTVKQHLRMQKLAWGKPMNPPREVTVRAHTVNLPERSFLRSALADMQPRIRERLQAEIEKATR